METRGAMMIVAIVICLAAGAGLVTAINRQPQKPPTAVIEPEQMQSGQGMPYMCQWRRWGVCAQYH